MSYRETEHLRVLIANERKNQLALVAPTVANLGHEVIAREIDVKDVGAVTARERPDVALVGLGKSSDHALALIDQIVKEAACPVILLIHAPDPSFVKEASKRGIFAYISDSEVDEWQNAIDIVLRRFAEYHDLEGAFGRRAVTERAKGISRAAQTPSSPTSRPPSSTATGCCRSNRTSPRPRASPTGGYSSLGLGGIARRPKSLLVRMIGPLLVCARSHARDRSRVNAGVSPAGTRTPRIAALDCHEEGPPSVTRFGCHQGAISKEARPHVARRTRSDEKAVVRTPDLCIPQRSHRRPDMSLATTVRVSARPLGTPTRELALRVSRERDTAVGCRNSAALHVKEPSSTLALASRLARRSG
jgi:AmiR/NasT family two-component response regulator